MRIDHSLIAAVLAADVSSVFKMPTPIKWNWRASEPFNGPVGATEEQKAIRGPAKGKGTRKKRKRK